MPRLPSICALLLPLCGGCVFPGPTSSEVPPVASGAAGPAGAVEAGHSTSTPPMPQAPTPASANGTVGRELAIWSDPSFQRRFAESYLAETDVEPPPLTEDEIETLQEVVELRANNQIDTAIERMREHTGQKASAVFDLTLAKLLLERERLAEATAAYEKAVEKHSKFRRAWNDLGLVRYRQGQYRAAAAALGRVVELGGGSPTIYGLLGFAHANNDDHLAAESAFRMATMLDPITIDWRMGLAHSLLKQRRFADAASLFGALIAVQPDRGELWMRQAQAYLGMNEPRKAAENIELVDRLGQAPADALDTLGNIYVNSELYGLAAGAYERAIVKDGQNGLAIGLRAAKALAGRGATAETQRILDRVEAIHGAQMDDGRRKEVLTLRARATVAASEEEAALLQQIVALDPLDGDALVRLGLYHERRAEIEQAVFLYERAAGIAAFEADAKLRHARLLASQGKYAEALPLLRRAQVLKPRDNVKQFLEQVERVAQARQ